MLPQVEFRQVLNHFCVRLSDLQFRKLLCKLGLSEGEEILVDWREFLEVFNLHKQEVRNTAQHRNNLFRLVCWTLSNLK